MSQYGTSKLQKPVVISCFLAACLEMYDFAIFGFLAAILHKNYLSFLDGNTALIITYTLFAVGFLFRPIGSLIFGYIGDIYGRKPALIISVSLMGIASLIMCLLPSYESIGISACYIIAVVRMIQGISVGGEYNGVTIYAIEHSNGKNIGLIGSLVTIGATLGLLLAKFVSNIIQNPSLPDYSWRFAFLLGFGLSIIGYFIRKKLRESPEFLSIKRSSGIPLIFAIKKYPKLFVVAILAATANISNVYYAVVFLSNYMKSHTDFDVGLFITVLIFIFTPIFGWISDKIGRVKLLWISSFLMAVYNLSFLRLLVEADSTTMVVIYSFIAGVLISAIVSSVNVFVVELFPTKCRFSSTAFCYSIGAAVFGGTTPMICTLLIKWFGDVPMYIGVYMFLVTVLGVVSAFMFRKRCD